MTSPELAAAEGITDPNEGEVAKANAELADALAQMQAQDPEGLSLRGDTEEQAFEAAPAPQPTPAPPAPPPPPGPQAPPPPPPLPQAQTGQEMLAGVTEEGLTPMGPRPAGVQDKHWVPDPNNPNQGRVNLAALTKSYNDLQSAFSQRAGPAPAVGDYFGEAEVAQLNTLGANVADANDPTLQDFAQAANEVGLSKEQAVNLASAYARHASARLPNPPPTAAAPDLASELARIGPEGATLELGNAQRIMAQHRAGTLSAADVQALARVNQTAEGIVALSKVLNTGEPNLPNVASGPADSQMTESEFNKAVENLDMTDKAAWDALLKKGQNMRLGA